MPVQHAPLWQGFKAANGNLFGSLFFGDKRIQISPTDSIAQNQYNGLLLDNSFYCSSTFINRHDFSNQFGLSYGNYWAKDYDPATNSYNYVGNQIGKGLYDRYYKSMISGLQARPKLRVCYVDLKITDILKLDFRKMIYLDGVYYKLVKVVDFQPHKNQPTKVELHQFSPKEGGSLPTEGVWVNNNAAGGAPFGGAYDPIPDDPNPQA